MLHAEVWVVNCCDCSLGVDVGGPDLEVKLIGGSVIWLSYRDHSPCTEYKYGKHNDIISTYKTAEKIQQGGYFI
jgi:hypothetical protein